VEVTDQLAIQTVLAQERFPMAAVEMVALLTMVELVERDQTESFTY
jgi:hypothetical protein